MQENVSEAVQAAGNYTGSLNYSEAVQLVSRPESVEQALLLYQTESSLMVWLTLLAFTPSIVLFVTGGLLEKYEDRDFWILFLSQLFFSVLLLAVLPFLISA